jgi:hypothetical protein
VGNHGDAVLGEEFPDTSGPRGMAHCHGAESRDRKTICEAVSDELNLEGVAERLCRQSDSWSGVGEETRDAPDPLRQRKRSSSSMDVQPFLNRKYYSNVLANSTLFLRMLVVAFRTFLWPSYQVSGRT